jgi:transposase
MDQLGEVPRAQRRAFSKPLAEYARDHRDPRSAMAAAYLSGHYSMKAIAEFFGVHYTTVSRAVGWQEGKTEE